MPERKTSKELAIDSPTYAGQSIIRLIAFRGWGEDAAEVFAYSTGEAIDHLLPELSDVELEDARQTLMRPNDFHAENWVSSPHLTLIQVWGYDRRDAWEIIRENLPLRRRDWWAMREGRES